jgi:hypothetical protein
LSQWEYLGFAKKGLEIGNGHDAIQGLAQDTRLNLNLIEMNISVIIPGEESSSGSVT